MGGRSPARRGAWGERGSPLYTPCTPVLPFCGNAEGVSVIGLYPVRRVSRGASARTFPALWAGRCPRLLWRSVRPSGVRDRLRARDIAASGAGRRGRPCRKSAAAENNGCAPAGRRQKGKGRQAGKKGERLRRKGRRTEEGRAPFEAACRSFIHSFFPCLGLLSGVGGGRKIGRREGPCVQPGFLQSIFSSFAEYFLIIRIL